MTPEDNDPLVADLICWIGDMPKPYADVMDAWRTACPRLTVWEDATDRGFVRHLHDMEGGRQVAVTKAG